MNHLASHPLPTTTGWSGGEFRNEEGEWIERMPEVYCGRCKGTFKIDQNWVDRYLAKRYNDYMVKKLSKLGFTVPSRV